MGRHRAAPIAKTPDPWLSSRPVEEPRAETCRYAAGLPHRDTRPLRDDDRRWVERRLRRVVAGVVLAATGVVAIMLGAMVVAQRAPGLAVMFRGGVGIGLLTLGGVGVLACLLLARGWWRGLALLGAGYLLGALAANAWLPAVHQPRWLTAEILVGTTVLGLSYLGLAVARRARLLRSLPRIRADLAAGRIECFEGPRPDGPLDEGLAPKLPPDPARPEHLRLEVLPRSGLVIRLGGRRVERWATAHMAQVAPAQPHALRVELPQGVAPAPLDPRLCLRRRSLTPYERAEIGRHIARLRRRRWPVAVLTLLVLGLVAWDLRTTAPGETIPLDGVSLGWLALLVVVYIGHGRRVLAARKLEHDRQLRWVVTVHEDAADPHHDPPTLEVLPISQLAWTEQASPAGWRLSRL